MTALLDELAYDSCRIAEPKVTVVVVDDHPIFAEGLRRVISAEPEFLVAGVATSVSEAIGLVARSHPDLVLMDDELPDGDGTLAASEIVRRWPETKVIMVAGQRNSRTPAVAHGQFNFVAKERPAQDVVTAMRLITHREGVNRPVVSRRPRWLTSRELEVLALFSNGNSTAEIAEELFVSVHTVRNHVRHILAKLGAHSKLEAAAIAARHEMFARKVVQLS